MDLYPISVVSSINCYHWQLARKLSPGQHATSSSSSGVLLLLQQVYDSHHWTGGSRRRWTGCRKASSKQPSMAGGRRQLTSKSSGHYCKTSSKQLSMGIMSRENSRGGFLLPSSRFLLSSILLLDSRLQFYHKHIHAGLLSETAMLPPSCHGGPGTLLCLWTTAF